MSDKINLTKNAQLDGQYQNRGLDTKTEQDTNVSISLMDIDSTIIKYMEDVIQPSVVQDDKKVSVPIMYGNPERWKSVRKDGVLRDVRGKLQIPLLMISRNSMRKNNLSNPVNKYHEKDFTSTEWNPRNKYDRFGLLNSVETSKKYVSVLYPDFYDLSYNCIVWTEYMQQMNHLVEQISFEVENYWGEREKYKFKTSVLEYRNTIQLPEKADRLVRSEFTMIVKAYLLPENTVDKYGRPINVNQTRFTPRKLIIREDIENF